MALSVGTQPNPTLLHTHIHTHTCLSRRQINVDGDTTLEERMGRLVYEFEAAKVAQVTYRTGLSIISLICNVERTSTILQRAFSVLEAEGINVQMMSQGASKTNISLVVNDAEGDRAIKALHAQFFPAAAVAAANGNGNGKAH